LNSSCADEIDEGGALFPDLAADTPDFPYGCFFSCLSQSRHARRAADGESRNKTPLR
jgi:hypothetical protein